MTYRRWSHFEETVLREYYPSCGGRHCATLLGRSLSSVRQKAMKLGVKEADAKTLRDLKNKRFGRLVVKKRVKDYVSPKGWHKIRWLCQCDCGKRVVVQANNLRSGNSRSCGCLRGEILSRHKLVNLIGRRFGRLKVESRVEDYVQPNGGKHTQWLCKCDCGNEILVVGTHLKSGHTVSCGCYLQEILSGSNSHFWKGGVTPVVSQIRNSSRYKRWRKSVFKRDNYTCQVSGESGQGNVVAHHIKPFYKILEENNIETFDQAERCEELWDVSNGVTLSKKWHSRWSDNDLAFHRMYGTRDFTKQDFYDWLDYIGAGVELG